MKKINVAIIGVGSFTKALVEGVSYYSKNPKETTGLLNPLIGKYRAGDINFVAAFDVDKRKVGKKLHDAIYAKPNVSLQITKSLKYEAMVYRGPTLDGVNESMMGTFVQESKESPTDVAAILKKTKADVVVNLVPAGGEAATHAYAEAAVKAGCSFVNCIPTPLVTIPEWRKKFADRGLALIGDDIKSQLGATMLNRVLLEFLKMRGIRILKSEQENIGGNADHYNLLTRAATKEKSKREALTKFLSKGDAKPTVKFFYTGVPSGHKHVNINIDGEMFGRTPIGIKAMIEDEISINGAGVALDAIRVAQLLVDKGMQKEIWRACPFLMKSPPRPVSDGKAYDLFQELIIARHGRK